MDPIVTFAIAAFISVLAIINPLSTIGIYLSLTRDMEQHKRHAVAFQASLAAFCVLFFFSLTGFLVFQIFGITIDAFRIAGGMVIFIIGMDILFPREGAKHEHSISPQAYLTPLAIPLTSGPGAITTVVVLSSQANNLWLELVLWSVIFVACVVNFIILRHSVSISRKIGSGGVEALNKLVGLLVCAVGVQFVINGLLAVFPILGALR